MCIKPANFQALLINQRLDRSDGDYEIHHLPNSENHTAEGNNSFPFSPVNIG